MNHAVQLVGWGKTADGELYWNVRNSWSAEWGELGYARLLRGVNCNGIADEPAYTFTIVRQECLALDCGRCVASEGQCGWCGGTRRCFAVASGEALCPLGWREANCNASRPRGREAFLSRHTCKQALEASLGEPAAYFGIRVDGTDWRRSDVCILGVHMSALQVLTCSLCALSLLFCACHFVASCLGECCRSMRARRHVVVLEAADPLLAVSEMQARDISRRRGAQAPAAPAAATGKARGPRRAAVA